MICLQHKGFYENQIRGPPKSSLIPHYQALIVLARGPRLAYNASHQFVTALGARSVSPENDRFLEVGSAPASLQNSAQKKWISEGGTFRSAFKRRLAITSSER